MRSSYTGTGGGTSETPAGRGRVLVVDADSTVRRGLTELLAPEGFSVNGVIDPDRALAVLGPDKPLAAVGPHFGVAVVDLDTPRPGAGLELVRAILKRSPATRVIVLVTRKSFDAAVAAFRAGAHDVIVKAPDQVDYLRARVLEAATTPAPGQGQVLADSVAREIRATLDDSLKRLLDAERRASEVSNALTGKAEESTQPSGLTVLVVDSDESVPRALEQALPPAIEIVHAATGGQALDRVSGARGRTLAVALVAPVLPDLPGSLVARGLKTEVPSLLVMTYSPGGPVEVGEGSQVHRLVDRLGGLDELAGPLIDVLAAFRAKESERRYLAAFRERHEELLRRMAEVKRKLERPTR